MRYRAFATALALVLSTSTGCIHSPLRARVQRVGAFALPSSQLHTPDPERSEVVEGERLTVQWLLGKPPRGEVLKIGVRLADARLEWYEKTLTAPAGHWLREWRRSPDQLGGVIAAYRIDLVLGDRVIASRKHPMWSEPVPIHTEG